MRQRILIGVLSISLCWLPHEALAVFGVGDIVFDPTAYPRHLETAISTAEMVKSMGQDLSVLSDYSEYASLIARATRVGGAVLQLSTRMQARYQRWLAILPGGEHIPCTAIRLLDWNRVYDEDTGWTVLDAAAAPQLLAEIQAVLATIPQGVAIARSIAGTVSGSQSLKATMEELLIAFQTSTAMRAPMDEMESRIQMKTLVNRQAQIRMAEGRMAGMYGRPKPVCPVMPGFGV